MAATPRIAPLVLERDGYTCVYCLADLDTDGVQLTIDHITPRSWFERGVVTGDADAASNLAACCGHCNSLKRDLNLDLFAAYLRAGHGWTAREVRDLKARVMSATARPLPE